MNVGFYSNIISNGVALAKSVYAERGLSYGFHRWLLRNYSGARLENENVCLVLIARDDTDKNVLFTPSLELIKLHHDPNIRMVYREFTSVTSINRVIKKIARKNRIIGLSVESHGNSFGLELNSKESIGLLNVYFLQKSFRYLDPNCVIVLKVCSTGKLVQDTCFAKMISEVARGRLVIAPSDEVESTGSSMWIEEGKLRASFRAEFKSGRVGLLGDIQNDVYALLFVFSAGYIGYSCTEEFKSPT